MIGLAGMVHTQVMVPKWLGDTKSKNKGKSTLDTESWVTWWSHWTVECTKESEDYVIKTLGKLFLKIKENDKTHDTASSVSS